MITGMKLGVCTGALVFFPNGGAGDPEVTGPRSCGVGFGKWRLLDFGLWQLFRAGPMAWVTIGYFARCQIKLFYPSFWTEKKSGLFSAHKMCCNTWQFEEKGVSFQTCNVTQNAILSLIRIIVCWGVRRKLLWRLSVLLAYKQAEEQAGLKYMNFLFMWENLLSTKINMILWWNTAKCSSVPSFVVGVTINTVCNSLFFQHHP